jgi:hypothetical protein
MGGFGSGHRRGVTLGSGGRCARSTTAVHRTSANAPRSDGFTLGGGHRTGIGWAGSGNRGGGFVGSGH